MTHRHRARRRWQAHEGGDTIRCHATDGGRLRITGELHAAEGDQHQRFAIPAE